MSPACLFSLLLSWLFAFLCSRTCPSGAAGRACSAALTCEAPSSLRGLITLLLKLYRLDHTAGEFFIFLIDLNDRSLVDVSSEDDPGCQRLHILLQTLRLLSDVC